MVLAVVHVGHGLVPEAKHQLGQGSLRRLSRSLIFPMRLVQDVRAAPHAEVVVDLPEPPWESARNESVAPNFFLFLGAFLHSSRI